MRAGIQARVNDARAERVIPEPEAPPTPPHEAVAGRTPDPEPESANDSKNEVASTGRLEVAIEPSEATVLVDGRFLGVTPLDVDLDPGTYRVTLRKEGWIDQEAQVVSPDCPKELETVILKLLAKAPDDRCPDAEHLLVELRDFLNRGAS